jgi:serine protease Do
MRFIRNLIADALIFSLLFVGMNYTVQKSPVIQSSVFEIQSRISALQADPITDVVVTGEATQEAVDKVKPAVVSIYGAESTPTISDFAYYTKVDAGTGFFVSSDGYIITNKHVVASETANYTVVLSNGKKKIGHVVYRDPDNDIAVVKIVGKDYPVLNIGDSSKLKVGQDILGIGNAYGKYKDTVSTGEVSGLHKVVYTEGDQDEVLDNVIQTNAQLYPGDSGGPLFDLNGNVVGVNVAIAAEKDNVSFSIPINDVMHVIHAIQEQEL